MPYLKNDIDKHKYAQRRAARKVAVVGSCGEGDYGNDAVLRTIKGTRGWLV